MVGWKFRVNKINFKELTNGWFPLLSITEIFVFPFTRSAKTLTFHTFPPLTTVLPILINFIFAMKANINNLSTQLIFLTTIIKSTNAQSLCGSAPCQNGGICELIDSVSSCDCSGTDFLGNFCTILSPCSSTPCQNGGRCQVFTRFADDFGYDSPVLDYFCQCRTTHTGTNCETELPCASNSGVGACMNEAVKKVCVNDVPFVDAGSFTCVCAVGFMGDFCTVLVPTEMRSNFCSFFGMFSELYLVKVEPKRLLFGFQFI